MTCAYCEKPILAKGMCSKHYTRTRNNGSPFVVKVPRGKAQDFINNIPDREDCILWPFKSHYKNGYGSVLFCGKLTGAHRAVCRIYNGEPPTDKHHAAHFCGKRNCVNPKHIRWALPSENELDKRSHGTSPIGVKNPMARLSEKQVAEIKKLKSRGKSEEVAEAFGCCPRTVRNIWSGKTWQHI